MRDSATKPQSAIARSRTWNGNSPCATRTRPPRRSRPPPTGWPAARAREAAARQVVASPVANRAIPDIVARWCPPERVNVVVDVLPATCRRCHRGLPARNRRVTGAPRCHQVTELPPIDAHVTDYHCPGVVGPSCWTTTYAPLQADVVGQFGPQLTALIAYLTVVCRMPRRVVQALLADALHAPIGRAVPKPRGKKRALRSRGPVWNSNRRWPTSP